MRLITINCLTALLILLHNIVSLVLLFAFRLSETWTDQQNRSVTQQLRKHWFTVCKHTHRWKPADTFYSQGQKVSIKIILQCLKATNGHYECHELYIKQSWDTVYHTQKLFIFIYAVLSHWKQDLCFFFWVECRCDGTDVESYFCWQMRADTF